MKILSWFLLFFHFIVGIFWIANSGILFSLFGMIIWIISIMSGFILYKQIREPKWVKKLVLYSSFFMIFLVLATVLIHLAVSSMP